LSNLISEFQGDDHEWLLDFNSLKSLRPWKSDENFLQKFQKVKIDNKILFVEQIIESVKQTQYINIPNTNFQLGQDGSQQFITQKRIIIDDVNSFFTKFLESA